MRERVDRWAGAAWSGTRRGAVAAGRGTWKGAVVVGKGTATAWRAVDRSREPISAARLEQGVAAMRPWGLVAALAAFVVGFSVDDLEVLRFPGYMLGIGASLLLFAVAPVWAGWRHTRAHHDASDSDYAAMSAMVRRLGQVAVLAMAIVTIAWFSIFSEGVPPWAAG